MDLRFAPGFKLMSHKQFTDYFEDKMIYPINIEISPSGICNAKCENCFYRQNTNELKGLDKALFDESRMNLLLQYELPLLGVKSISWTGGGEPTQHPAFPKFVKGANESGLEQGLFTNGLRHIGCDPRLFEWIRVTKTNVPLNEEVIMSLRSCKTIGICINYSKKDTKQIIRDALKIAEKLEEAKEKSEYSTYVQVRPALLINGKSYENEVPKISHPLLKITNYKFMGMTNERNYNNCEAYHFAPFIWQDGDVDMCGYHRKEKKFNLGNLYNEGKEGQLKTIMEKAPKNIKVADNCQVCCKLNEMNSIIQFRKDLAKKDINFP